MVEKMPVAGVMGVRVPPSVAGEIGEGGPPYSVPLQANWRLTTPPEGEPPDPSRNGATKVAAPVATLIRYKPGAPAARVRWEPHRLPAASNAIPAIPSMVQDPAPVLGMVTPVHDP